MNMIHFTEETYEKALIKLFQDLGYTYKSGYDVDRDVHEPYYKEELEKQIRNINPGIPQEAIDEALRKLYDMNDFTLIQNNEKFMDALQNGLEAEISWYGEMRTYRVKLVSYKYVDANSFLIVNQWRVEEKNNKIRLDLAVLINGLPLVVIELKTPSGGAKAHDAYMQIKNYQQKCPVLFTYNAFNVISDMAKTKAGTITAKEERYMEWKTKDGSYESTQFADYRTFFEGIFQKDCLLEIIHDYICFDKNEGAVAKILACYHQYYAVKKAVMRTYPAVKGDGKIGVFWHTQGSGKSLSMVFFAHQLIQKFPEITIVVVTDRKDLDQQLHGQFSRCREFLRQTPETADSREDLISLLKNRKAGGIIFTTIQKFEEGEGPLSQRKNIIVMTDEAHRSQYGDEHWDSKDNRMKKGFARLMREALPNASFIGFTGTPISNRDKDTQEVFGNYIDVYDMTQAVEDGATRPVYYESRVVNLKLDDDILKQLDTEFELLEEGDEESQVMKTKQNLSHLDAVLGAKETINSLVDDILNHYENYRANELTGKAMIVAYNRTIAMKIFFRILELRPDWQEKVKVVMTSSNKDPESWSKYIGNDHYKKELAKKFKDDKDPMKIAIVVDMWLTGFDVPSLATMYVYKPMAGHNLMQAIARVNRVFPGKEGGLIVDYIGIAQALQRAMKDYTGRDQKRFGNPDIAKTAHFTYKEKREICQDLLHGFKYTSFYTATDAERVDLIKDAANFFLEVGKEETKKNFLKESALLHNSVTLCKSLLSKTELLEVVFMDAVRGLLLKWEAPGKIHKKEINQQISNLLKQSVKSDGTVINIFQGKEVEFSLFDEEFLKGIQKMKQKNMAVELLKRLLAERVSLYKRTNLVQSARFSDMLRETMNQYINGHITNADTIEHLLKLAAEIKATEEEGNSLGLSQEEKAFYDALTRPEAIKDFYSNDQLVELTKALTEQLRKNRTIDWKQKESARAKMRVMVKRLLKHYKYPPEGQEQALQMVMDQCNQWADDEDNYEDDNVVNMYTPMDEAWMKAAE